jgi:Na+/H+ antiporter NhaC
LLLVVGVQLISIGLLGELVVRTYHESQEKPIYRVRTVLEGHSELTSNTPAAKRESI